MKTDIIKKHKDIKPSSIYPCLKAYKDGSYIVLFSGSRTGLVVWSDFESKWIKGDVSATWHDPDFHIWNGTIQLSNGDL